MSDTIFIVTILILLLWFPIVWLLWLLWKGTDRQSLRLQALEASQSDEEAHQELERQIGRTLDQSLGGLGQRFHDSLMRQTTETSRDLGTLREKLGAIDQAQQQFRDLGQHVVDLKNLLGNRQARGALGEIHLQHLLGQVLPQHLYRTQETLSNNRRPDCLLLLPSPPGNMVIDAKFPLEGYRQWLQDIEGGEVDKANIDAALRRFGQDVRQHINAIAERYIIPGETADFALMYLPAEAVYAEIHASLPDVIEYGFKKKVFLVSPTTMMATFTTIRGIVRDVQLQQQAGEVQRLVGLIAADVTRLNDRVGNLQRHFNQTEKDIADITRSVQQISQRADKIAQIELADTD